MTPVEPASDPAAVQEMLRERYGRRRPARARPRWLWPGLAALFVAAASAVAISLATAGPDLQAELAGWDASSDDHLDVSMDLQRPADTAVSCDLVAVDLRTLVVGQEELVVPADGRTELRVSTRIPLRAPAVAPELRSCTLLD